MSKDDFIKNMRELLYRIDAPAAQATLERALDLYESNRPSDADQAKLHEVEDLRVKADLIEKKILWKPPAEEVRKSVDEVVAEIAKTNDGIVKSRV